MLAGSKTTLTMAFELFIRRIVLLLPRLKTMKQRHREVVGFCLILIPMYVLHFGVLANLQ